LKTTPIFILILSLVVAIATTNPAKAQTTSEKPIRIIVPAVTGSVYDIYARRYAPHLSQMMGQPVIVDNKPGAAGNIAMEQVSRAPTDGTTLGIVSISEMGVLRLIGHPHIDVDALLTPVGFIPTRRSLGPKGNADVSLGSAPSVVQNMTSSNESYCSARF
jgi:tripartite-type tricarboxylate transporter receptor subunit TctC